MVSRRDMLQWPFLPRLGVLATLANSAQGSRVDTRPIRSGGRFHPPAARRVGMPAQPNGHLIEALAFDDVLLKPGLSEVLPSEADVRTRITRSIPLNIPIIASAMDTVTEARMAIAM